MHRRRFLVLALGVMAAGGCGPGSRMPTAGRLTVVAPAARGQGWDRAARALAMVLTGDQMARTVEVSNYPGGLGAAALGAFPAARGPFMREGRLLLTGMPMVAGAEIANAASVAESTTPLARLVGDWAALVVPDGSHLRAFEDFAAALRRDPAGLTVGGRMEGGSDHVLYGMIGKCLGVDTRLLDYAGYSNGIEAAQALHEGRVAALLGSARSFVPEIAAGRLRPLVVSSAERIDGIDAPTLMELDIRLEYTDWCGVLGPRGMSAEDRDAAVALCDRVDASSRWRAVCVANGWNRVYLSGDDFRQWLVTETGRTREVLNELGLLSTFSTSCWGSCVRRPYM
ncbi:putative tricarboxylic transport membrane protein [Streptosporangium album]|uniref:Putative tricarboxylic transport membrane protein n=1 Tax=Streptosporangium album TaxID=47479 RepID=A0A7W7S321_9ACTN|nr:tripartite tricarboxylate transporter substrate-binding protein [Streptosporangium album]MBB4942547.1 putative tricarboxylic transport membrane protein [Streptosporangium album]